MLVDYEWDWGVHILRCFTASFDDTYPVEARHTDDELVLELSELFHIQRRYIRPVRGVRVCWIDARVDVRAHDVSCLADWNDDTDLLCRWVLIDGKGIFPLRCERTYTCISDLDDSYIPC